MWSSHYMIFSLLSKCIFPSCDAGGPDHICSDGKCYSESGCPLGHIIISNNSCTCVEACTNPMTSHLQVMIKI